MSPSTHRLPPPPPNPSSTSCLIGSTTKARYAYVSQRGYYPDEPNKANQDAFNIVRDFLSDGSWFFGVFDGHGKEGDLCAQYAKRNLGNYIGRGCRGKTEKGEIERAMTTAHIKCNEDMHRDKVSEGKGAKEETRERNERELSY